MYPTGELRWKFKSNGGIYAPPALDSDGTVYFGNWGNSFYAIGNQGEGNTNENSSGTPGFEIISLIVAISLIFYINKKRKR